MKEIFQKYYETNFWGNSESVSGNGSDLKSTEVIRDQIPKLMEQWKINSVLDIPCGDIKWAREMIWPGQYIGADIVPDMIQANREHVAGISYFSFRVLDAAKDPLPKVDMILCRDMLGHFSHYDVKRTLKNFRASGSKYLLSTTFPDHETVGDIKTGEWRPINLASLYGLPDPVVVINEGLTGEFADKSLGLWRLDERY